MRRYAIFLATLLVALAGMTLVNPPAASASRSCPNYTVDNMVANVVSVNGFDYILSRSGAVYTQCAPYFGGANGQSYFAGRTAKSLHVCTVNGTPVGYRITATNGQTYHYGRFYSCGGLYGGPEVADYWLAAPVTDVAAVAGRPYILTTDGGVFANGGPFFGAPRGQSYFAGRTADYLEVRVNSGNYPVGYTVVATSNERYSYGS